MNFLEAIKASKHIRRPTAKYLGSAKNGFVDAKYAFENGIISWNDLFENDWEVGEMTNVEPIEKNIPHY